MTDTPGTATKRSNDDRTRRFMKIQISNDRIGEVDAILRNATDMGAGVKLQAPLKKGEKVLITIKDLEPLMCKVAWSKQEQAGLRFEKPVEPSLLTVRNTRQVKGEGMFCGAEGYHVFDRFQPINDFKRPALKLVR